jgi:hypothetical protein
MAQGVDVQIGRDRDDRYDRDRRRYDSDATVGVGPGGVTVGPRQRCRMETTTIERDDAAGSRAGSVAATRTASIMVFRASNWPRWRVMTGSNPHRIPDQ